MMLGKEWKLNLIIIYLCIENCVDGSAFVQIEFIMVSGCALIRR